MFKLLTKQSAKLDKSQSDGVLSVIMYLDPMYNRNICKGASAGCRKSCLIYSGRMAMTNAVQARKKRTDILVNHPDVFKQKLMSELKQAHTRARKQGKKLAARLNGTSDLDFSEYYKAFPDIQFYEYTKRPDLAEKISSFPNVDVTFSKNENHTEQQVLEVLDKGTNVAVVFIDSIPKVWAGRTVINGDVHDRRFEDKKGQIVGLKLKGTNKAKKAAIKHGFAV